MAVASMSKIGVVGMRDKWDEIIDHIQEQGIIHISRFEAEEDDVYKSDSDEIEEQKELHERINHSLEFLERFIDYETEKVPITQEKLQETISEFPLEETLEVIEEYEEEMHTLSEKLGKRKALKKELKPWLVMENKLSEIKDTDSLLIQSGYIPSNLASGLFDEIEDSEYDLVEIEEVASSHRETYVLIIAYKGIKQAIQSLLSKYEFTEWSPRELENTPQKEIEKLDKEIKKIENKILETEKEIEELKGVREELSALRDYYKLKVQQREVEAKVAQTESTFLIKGWIESDNYEDLKESLQKNFKATEVFEMPVDEDEAPPTALDNKEPIKPFEVLTDLYGRPKKGMLDPTPIVTPFFLLFFAFCVTDAGYGIIITLASIIGLKKVTTDESTTKFLKFLLYLGGATIVVGALGGGYFGLNVSDYETTNFLVSLGKTIKIFDPLNDAISFFALTMGFGMVQVALGFLLNGIVQFGRKKNIFLNLKVLISQTSWALTATGLGIFILQNLVPEFVEPVAFLANIFIVVGIIGIISGMSIFGALGGEGIFKSIISALGFDGVYGIFQVFGDILSYSRILALGLSTAVIAGVINIIAKQLFQLPYGIGVPFAIIILIAAHCIYTALAGLSAFVHPARLQYVEFFTKFYETGGENFKPFKKEYKNIEFKEE